MRAIDKIGLGALVIICIILGSVKLSMDNLKEEAENSLMQIASLHANTFNEEITQLFSNISIISNSLTNQISDERLLVKSSKTILVNNAHIRSIYILDKNYEIIYSTVESNIGQKIDIQEYYPKPMFDDRILRFGNIQKGRDFFSKDTTLSFIPVVKKVTYASKDYFILFTINNDYFTNRYSEYLNIRGEQLEIIRMDNTLLYSSQLNQKKDIYFGTLYEEAKAKSFSYGIEEIAEKKTISAYYLSDIFPLIIAVKLDYEKNLKEWDFKTLLALFMIGIIVFLIAYIIIKLLVKAMNAKNKEIAYQKQQIQNQEKIRNAYVVYENTNDGILITDEECHIIDINKAFSLNTYYSLDEVYGLNPRFLKSGMHEDIFYEQMWEAIEKNNYWHGEIINKKKNGELYTELLTINKVFDNDKKTKNYIGVFTNITKQKEQEQQLKEQEELIFHQSKMASMGEMLENIAHQWRQPLSVISTAATAPIMEHELGIENSQTDLDRFKLINESAQHLSKTIDDFRDFFRPDKEKKVFSISQVFEHSLKILDSKFKNRDIHVIQNIEEIELLGYESEMIQVIMNILNNARDALEHTVQEQRFIFIDIYKQNNTAILIIKDSGGGISEEIIHKIFEPYFTTKHQSQGTGIGLYMSEEIITKHMHGMLKVKNTQYRYNNTVLVGAEFTIQLPL